MAYPPFHPSSNAPVPLFMSRAEFGEAFPAENDYVERKSGVGRAAVQTPSLRSRTRTGA
jgi:hypothetical protein